MRNNPDFLYYQVRNHREHAREFKKEERKKNIQINREDGDTSEQQPKTRPLPSVFN